jgi:hypothetical protein
LPGNKGYDVAIAVVATDYEVGPGGVAGGGHANVFARDGTGSVLRNR